jgi:glycine cleavage system transcriptional repressor
MVPVYNYLIVSVLGTNRAGILSELSRAYAQYGCNLLHAKINVLGQDVAAFFFLAGNWGAIAKLEAALPALEQRLSLTIQSRRTQELPSTHPLMTYTVQVIAVDRSGLLNELFDLFHKEAAMIEEASAYTYPNGTGTTMLNIQLKIHLPTTVHLATLREAFMNYCDNHNFEGFLDPARN